VIDQSGAFDDYPYFNAFADTGETFFTPVVLERARLQEEQSDINAEEGEEDILEEDVSPGLEFCKQHDQDEFSQPITRVMKCEEAYIIEMMAVLTSHRSGRNRNVFKSVDYAAMTDAWNSECFTEFLNPLSERQNIYPKTSQLLRKCHNRLKQ
jgi:hypothetical protein